MKIYKIKKIIFKYIWLIIINVISFQSTSNNLILTKKIFINSEKQFIDLKKKKLIFKKNVIIKYNFFQLSANELIIDNQNKIIFAYGTPIIFYHLNIHNHNITGHSNQIIYKIIKKTIILIGNAYIKESHNSIYSDIIIYEIKNKKIQAFNYGKKKIKSIITYN